MSKVPEADALRKVKEAQVAAARAGATRSRTTRNGCRMQTKARTGRNEDEYLAVRMSGFVGSVTLTSVFHETSNARVELVPVWIVLIVYSAIPKPKPTEPCLGGTGKGMAGAAAVGKRISQK
jgi:hypothetical protein